MRTRIKICGITRPEDGLAAARLGADAIGLVFYPKSPRCVSPGQARAVVDGLPPFVTVVALFVDAGQAEIEAVLGAVRIDLLQFHGKESPEDCRRFGVPWIKALRMKPGMDPAGEAARYAGARALLLDAYQPGVPGGTGTSFDWCRVPRDLPLPVILAGGLDAGNVARAVEQTRPYAVDVSGGVEQKKGIKDRGKIAAFVREVAGVDQDHQP